MGAKMSRKPWLWAAAAVLFSSAPALAACDVPTISGGNIRGRVYDLLGSQAPPLVGATVRLVNDSGKVVAQVVAQQDGWFAISAPERGRYRLTVTAEGFLEVSAAVVVKKLGKNTPLLRVDLGSDVSRPCGGGGITVQTTNRGAIGR